MNGRLGCSVDSVELNQPEDKQPSVIHNYATTHCIRKKIRSPLLSINHGGFLYLSTPSHQGIAPLQSGNQKCAFWLGNIVIIQAVMGLKHSRIPYYPF
jgi:hypothetical protein